MWAPPSFGLLILYIVYTAVDTTSCVNTMPRLPAGAARGGNLCTLRGGRRQPLHIALLRRGCDRHTSLPLTRNSTTPTSSVAIHLPVTYASGVLFSLPPTLYMILPRARPLVLSVGLVLPVMFSVLFSLTLGEASTIRLLCVAAASLRIAV